MKQIVRIQFGSHLYGTNTPQSDLDYKAVHLPSGRDIVLQNVSNSVSNKPSKQGEGQKNEAGDHDEESYSLQRFLQLSKDGQTVAIDMLFAPPQNTLETSELWRIIQENRHRLLTKRSAAFVGYCRQQANKYGIKGSRVAAAKAAMEFFEAGMKNLGATAKVSEVSPYMVNILGDHTQLVEQQVNSAGDMGWFLECCNRKVSFDASVKQGYEIFSRIYANYGNRAKLAESNESVDWKALSHAVRVGREALELLETGHITFPLRYADRILQIKRGELVYPVVADEIEELLVEVETAAEKSSLPESPDEDFIDELIYEHYRNQVLSTEERRS